MSTHRIQFHNKIREKIIKISLHICFLSDDFTNNSKASSDHLWYTSHRCSSLWSFTVCVVFGLSLFFFFFVILFICLKIQNVDNEHRGCWLICMDAMSNLGFTFTRGTVTVSERSVSYDNVNLVIACSFSKCRQRFDAIFTELDVIPEADLIVYYFTTATKWLA